jgi:hypothetical protein
MEIAGGIGGGVAEEGSQAWGAFALGGASRGGDGTATDLTFDFYASRNWTGETSQNGAHSHTVTIGNAGSGSAVDIRNQFFTMAFFIKLPE